MGADLSVLGRSLLDDHPLSSSSIAGQGSRPLFINLGGCPWGFTVMRDKETMFKWVIRFAAEPGMVGHDWDPRAQEAEALDI